MAQRGDISPQDRGEEALPRMKNQMNADKTPGPRLAAAFTRRF
jgi:hypothetical protein